MKLIIVRQVDNGRPLVFIFKESMILWKFETFAAIAISKPSRKEGGVWKHLRWRHSLKRTEVELRLRKGDICELKFVIRTQKEHRFF